jgi:hypothetical protein
MTIQLLKISSSSLWSKRLEENIPACGLREGFAKCSGAITSDL